MGRGRERESEGRGREGEGDGGGGVKLNLCTVQYDNVSLGMCPMEPAAFPCRPLPFQLVLKMKRTGKKVRPKRVALPSLSPLKTG